MNKLIVCITAFVLFAACHNGTTTHKNADSSPVYILKKDTTAPAIVENSDPGNIAGKDSFTVDGIQFRYAIKEETIGSSLTVEKFDNGKWIACLNYDYSIRTDSILKDVNNDGFVDVINKWKWETNAYLYNKATKNYDTTITVNLENEWQLIDTAANLFCDETNIKGIEEASTLYTFNGLEKVVLYSINFTNKQLPNEDFPVITEYKLYKGDFDDNGTLLKSTKVNDTKFEFDYVAYWKANYKQLTGGR